MKICNKLVRDKIPQIIEENNNIPVTRILSEEEYLSELDKKLKEELDEYLADGNVEELADMMEVMLGILAVKGVQYDKFEKIRMDKVLERGAFEQRIFLEKTLERDE